MPKGSRRRGCVYDVDGIFLGENALICCCHAEGKGAVVNKGPPSPTLSLSDGEAVKE